MNQRVMPVPRTAVWEVLSDGWVYGDWVVGASKIRHVEAGYPKPGTKLHYRIGRGPLRHDDETEVLDMTDGERLVLEARAWPVGTARVELRLYDQGETCRVWMGERPIRGIGGLLHNPVQDAVLRLRNVECLRRLERLAQQRHVSGTR